MRSGPPLPELRDSAGAGPIGAATRSAGAPDTGATTELGAPVVIRETDGQLSIRVAATGPTLDAQQAAALDSAAVLLRQDPTRRAVIRYTDPSFTRTSESWRLAERALDRLVAGRIERNRLQRVRVPAVNGAGLPRSLDAVEVVVRGPVHP